MQKTTMMGMVKGRGRGMEAMTSSAYIQSLPVVNLILSQSRLHLDWCVFTLEANPC